MNEMFKSAENRDAYETLTTIQALSQYEALMTTSEQEELSPETVINMSRVIERNQVVYFWLPSAIESISAREIGKLGLFALLTAAIDRQLTNPQEETKQVFLVIDEFQRLAGDNFKIILEQARSFGLSAILANQSLSDLKSRDGDLRSTVLTNTRMRLFFTINDPLEMKMISTLSGEEIRILKSWTTTDDLKKRFRRDTQSETHIEGFKSRFTVNDILSISDHPLEMIAHITRGNGYTQFGGMPIRVRTAFPISRKEYAKRSKTPWPSKEEFGVGEVIENLRSPKEIDDDAMREVSLRQQEILQQAFPDEDEQVAV
jgi:hypothetical protein